MISKEEIDAKANELDIQVSNVQRDYIFGWLLAGIYSQSNLGNLLILKGGNCFRKAYFQNTRYSNDLDFSTQAEVDTDRFLSEINNVCRFVQDRTGVEFVLDRNWIESDDRRVDKESTLYKAKVYFKGFYGEEDVTISAKLDVKEFDKIYLPLQNRNLIHPYSDYDRCQASIRCLKLEEMLALKLKALLQRVHVADLYDFVYPVFIARALDVNRTEIITTLLKKTIYERNPRILKNLLLELPFQLFKGFWSKYLICPSGCLPSFESAEETFRDLIGSFFALPQYAVAGGYADSFYYPSELRNKIMEAGREQKLMEIVYDGFRRIVEPYALSYKTRKDGVAKEYLYVWDRVGGRSGPGVKAMTRDKLSSLAVLEETFEPRFEIELAKAGELGHKKYFARPFASSGSRSPRGRTTSSRHSKGHYGPTYIIECFVCGKRFPRTSYSTALNPHKDKYGNNCFGRTGYMVETKY